MHQYDSAVFGQRRNDSISNPLPADAKGRFGFWAAHGNYVYSIQTVAGASIGSYNISLTWFSGTNTNGTWQRVGAVMRGSQKHKWTVGDTVLYVALRRLLDLWEEVRDFSI